MEGDSDLQRLAYGMLARRPLTRRELGERLLAKGHVSERIESFLDRLIRENLLDDRALAENALELRSERLGYGPRRLIEELVQRGVSRETAEAAWDDLVDEGRVDVRRTLDRRLERQLAKQRGELDARALGRVYSALIRAGYGAADVRRALADRFGAEWMSAPR